MKTRCTTLAWLLVLILSGNLLAQADEPKDPDSPEAPTPGESAPQLAPNFNLPGTGDTRLRLRDAKQGSLAMFFYGDDGAHSASRILGSCRDHAEDFKTLHSQLCLIGTSKVESHERLLERMPMELALYHDKRAETQEELGLDPRYPGWAVISSKGAIVDSDLFDGGDPESIARAIALALQAVKSLILADAPNFVRLLGEPLDSVRDLATLPDGRVVALTGDSLVFILGDTNEVMEVEGGGLQSLMVDHTGLLHFSAGGELRLFHDSEGMVPVLTPGPETGTGVIERISGHASSVIMFLRGGKLHALLPASGRVVALVEEDDVIDLVPTPDNTLLLLRNRQPYFQILDRERNLVDLLQDEKLTRPPTTAVIDPAGRIFVGLRKQNEIFVLDSTGRVVSSFPVRGGGVEGTPLFLSVGAGYLDAAVRDSKTREIRIMRFAL